MGDVVFLPLNGGIAWITILMRGTVFDAGNFAPLFDAGVAVAPLEVPAGGGLAAAETALELLLDGIAAPVTGFFAAGVPCTDGFRVTSAGRAGT